MTCPTCGNADTQARPSGDRVCPACGTQFKVVSKPPEVPRP